MKPKVFCVYCGDRLEEQFLEGKMRQVCEGCKQISYENPLPVVSVMVPNDRREILLVKREREPSKNMWCFPIGFAESGESIQEAALRELKEEAGIDGRIIQIIDVGSEGNEMYGELLIVTFEAEKIGGVETAGDDACDVGYFPATNLPRLAFSSQERALGKFIELKRDIWSMRDSFERFVETSMSDNQPGEGLLSDALIDLIERNVSTITELWISDISSNPSTKAYHSFPREELASRAEAILGQLRAWLNRAQTESELKAFYVELGNRRRRESVALGDLISSLSLLKKHIFHFATSMGVWSRAVDMYRVFELGERLVYFFDRASYYAVTGYLKVP
jgi:8-oxo-dGTP diphosphatase